MKIVIDTNILYSALKSRRGASFKLISRLPSKRFDVLLSVPLYSEYQDVLLRKEFLTTYFKAEILGFLRYFCKLCNHKEIFYLWRPVLRDPKDDMVLELAVAGGCDFIVTHNLKDFSEIKEFRPTAVTPSNFLNEIGG